MESWLMGKIFIDVGTGVGGIGRFIGISLRELHA